MSGAKRSRSSQGDIRAAFAKAVIGAAKKMKTRRRRLYGAGSATLSRALSQVHSFKRVGEPVVIAGQSNPAVRAIAAGNTDLLGGSGTIAASADQFLATNLNSQVRGAFRFCLQQAANIAEITNLFDNYRITGVELLFQFSCNDQTVVPNNGGALPIIHYAFDPDDNVTPPSRTSVLENGYCYTKRLDQPMVVRVSPRAQQSVVGGTAGAGGVLPQATWLDSNSPQIYHYGMKFWIDQFPYNGTTDWTHGITVTPTFYIEAKNVN